MWCQLLLPSKVTQAQMYVSEKQKQTHRHRDQMWGCRGGRGSEWDGREVGERRCKLGHREGISRGVLLSSSGHSVQSLRMDQDGSEYEKGNRCICMTGGTGLCSRNGHNTAHQV